MRRLVLSCLAALLAVLGLSAASSGSSSEAQAFRVTVVAAAAGASADGAVASREVVGGAEARDVLAPLDPAVLSAGEEEREPVFLGMLALAAVAAGLGASARLHTAARRRTG